VKSKKATKVNTDTFGSHFENNAAISEYKDLNKLPSKSKFDIRSITTELEHELGLKSNGAAQIAVNLAMALYKTAERENVKYIHKTMCPECLENHYITCPKCKKHHDIKVLDPVAEKTSMFSAKVLLDKYIPNKAPKLAEFPQEEFETKVSEFVARMISMLPEELRDNYLGEWVAILTMIRDNE
jgi:hypothetical protein